MPETEHEDLADVADWHRRVVGRSLRTARKRSIDRGSSLIRAAATLLERSGGDSFTVQDVADEAGQSLRTLYQYFESKDDLLLAVFEEAMRTYAQLVSNAITDLDDPLDRLAGALIAAVRMPEFVGTGVDRGLARLRLKLGAVEPELVARSQEPITALLEQLVADAAVDARVRADDPDEAAYLAFALMTTFITNHTLGNDLGAQLPTQQTLVAFCLTGLGASLDANWYERIGAELRLPKRRARSGRSRSVKAAATTRAKPTA